MIEAVHHREADAEDSRFAQESNVGESHLKLPFGMGTPIDANRTAGTYEVTNVNPALNKTALVPDRVGYFSSIVSHD